MIEKFIKTDLPTDKEVLLVLNGNNISDIFLKKLAGEFKTVYAADGASDRLFKEKIIPDFIIGDLDSISDDAKEYMEDKGVKFCIFPKEKDQTDSEIALEILRKNGIKTVCAIGAFGLRFDHSLGNLNLLYRALKRDIRFYIVDEHNFVTLLNPGKYEIHKKTDCYFSIISATEKTTGVSISGAKYNLNEYTLNMDVTVGISNEFKSDVTLKFETGKIFLCISSKNQNAGNLFGL